MRNLLTLLTVTVLALRSLLPVGFMLASHAGEMTVVICTGHGAETVTIDADGKRVPAKPRRGRSRPLRLRLSRRDDCRRRRRHAGGAPGALRHRRLSCRPRRVP
ncbi:MAG: hypothetical protein WDN31_21050 [Hyphomicrobium sp.]